jgi:site-specific DNA recombinase
MTKRTATTTGRELQRVSKDASGRERSNDEQHDDNVAGAAEHGITIAGAPYRDRARASRTSRDKRPGFDRLMADLAADTFTEDILVMWESSRGDRRVSVWCALLELLEERGKRVFVTSHGRIYDPANPRDRRSLLEDAVDSEYESGKSSLRIGRSMRANADNGERHGGRRAYGYAATGNATIPGEVKVIEECVRRVLGGDSVREIAASLNARGIKTSAGNDWHPGPLKAMIAGHRIAGVRTHKGRVVAKGTWPAIISEDTHRRVCATLAARKPAGRRGRTPWVLTGFLRCERCSAALVGNTDTGGTRRYVCRKAPGYHGCGSLGIKAAPLEELLGDLATERLADVEARRTANVAADDADELAELNRIAAKRIELADDYAADRISKATRLEDAAALDRRQRDVEARLAAKTRQSAPLDFVAAEGFIGRRWDDLEVSEQRLVLNALVEHVTVAPATTRGSTKFEPARVTAGSRIAWKI